MSCFHPLKGFKVGYNPSGKPNYYITSYDAIAVRQFNDSWQPCFEKIPTDTFANIITESIDIPCGHCIGCYLDRSRQWADRCMMEAKYHDHNCFITLTYDDDHLPQTFDPDGVEVGKDGFHTLCKEDFTKFMKRFRRAIEPAKVRFFACGEYGSQTFRPHYHAIIFGYDFPDKYVFRQNFRGDKYYRSPLLEKLWTNGISCVADFEWDCAAYVSRYCLKKSHNDLTKFYELNNLTPEYVVMSRKPGIARQFYEDRKEDFYKYGQVSISDKKGSKTIRAPRYFDRLYDIDYPSDFERIKQKRKEFAEYQKEMILAQTDLDYLDYLKVKEDNLHKRTKIFGKSGRSKV